MNYHGSGLINTFIAFQENIITSWEMRGIISLVTLSAVSVCVICNEYEQNCLTIPQRILNANIVIIDPKL